MHVLAEVGGDRASVTEQCESLRLDCDVPEQDSGPNHALWKNIRIQGFRGGVCFSFSGPSSLLWQWSEVRLYELQQTCAKQCAYTATIAMMVFA